MMQAMSQKRPFAAFRRLQWKLTFSYTLVTVGTLLVVELLVGGLLYFLFFSNIFTSIVQDSMQNSLEGQARTFLEQTPPDIDGLRIWADSLVETTTELSITGGISEKTKLQFGNLSIETDERQQLYFMDADLVVLAQVPGPVETAVLNHPFDTASVPNSAQLLQNALQNPPDTDTLFMRHDDGTFVITAPIVGSKGDLLGVMLLTYALPIFEASTILPILQAVLFTLIPFTIGVGFVGTIFGFLTARGLAQRLQRMSQTADAWSQGDFSVAAHDASGDELGQLNRSLNRMAEQLQNLLQTRQELATLEERNRLARDLHDTVKQHIFATVMQLGAAQALADSDPSATRTHLAEAEQLARQAQQELTGLIQELRPAALAGKGLAEALHDYATDWSRRTLIAANVAVQGERPLPLPIEQALFRIAQEALANVARHSQAGKVEIGLTWQETAVSLTIQDNGQGFELAANEQTGMGLQNMAERAAEVNGRLDVQSKPGAGTAITVTIPQT